MAAERSTNPFPQPSRPKRFVSDAGERVDHRGIDELRPILMKTRVVSRAVGSSFVQLSNTKCICAVYGPRPLKASSAFSHQGVVQCDVKFAPFAQHDRKKPGQGDDERELSRQVQEALQLSVRVELFPKSMVEVFVVVLENDGGATAAAVTAASLAIADAGIEQFDLVCGCGVALVDSHILLDPTHLEERYQTGSVTVAMLAQSKNITMVMQEGQWTQEQTSEAIELCVDACGHVHDQMHRCLARELSRPEPMQDE